MFNASIQTGRPANQPGAQFICNKISGSEARLLGRGILKSRIVFGLAPQAEDEDCHDPGVLSHLLDKAVTICTERWHRPETFVSLPRRKPL
jgi:hypothetical protein